MSVNISGIWHNEHGSEVTLELSGDGHLTGTFRTGVGFGTHEPSPVSGFAHGALVVFAVDFSKYGSLTSWVGHVIDSDGPELRMLWQMTVEVPHPKRSDELWKTVWSGANTFRRGPAPPERTDGRHAPPLPLWMA